MISLEREQCRPDEMSFVLVTQFRAQVGGKLTLANPEKVILALQFWQTRSTLLP